MNKIQHDIDGTIYSVVSDTVDDIIWYYVAANVRITLSHSIKENVEWVIWAISRVVDEQIIESLNNAQR